MSEGSKIEQAVSRFETALHQLEKSLVRVHEKESRLVSAKGQTEALQTDRDKLAKELQEVRAKAEDLTEVNRQAAKRVDQAFKRIEKVLG